MPRPELQLLRAVPRDDTGRRARWIRLALGFVRRILFGIVLLAVFGLTAYSLHTAARTIGVGARAEMLDGHVRTEEYVPIGTPVRERAGPFCRCRMMSACCGFGTSVATRCSVTCDKDCRLVLSCAAALNLEYVAELAIPGIGSRDGATRDESPTFDKSSTFGCLGTLLLCRDGCADFALHPLPFNALRSTSLCSARRRSTSEVVFWFSGLQAITSTPPHVLRRRRNNTSNSSCCRASLLYACRPRTANSAGNWTRSCWWGRPSRPNSLRGTFGSAKIAQSATTA